jgi:hypothetical protein
MPESKFASHQSLKIEHFFSGRRYSGPRGTQVPRKARRNDENDTRGQYHIHSLVVSRYSQMNALSGNKGYKAQYSWPH